MKIFPWLSVSIRIVLPSLSLSHTFSLCLSLLFLCLFPSSFLSPLSPCLSPSLSLFSSPFSLSVRWFFPICRLVRLLHFAPGFRHCYPPVSFNSQVLSFYLSVSLALCFFLLLLRVCLSYLYCLSRSASVSVRPSLPIFAHCVLPGVFLSASLLSSFRLLPLHGYFPFLSSSSRSDAILLSSSRFRFLVQARLCW